MSTIAGAKDMPMATDDVQRPLASADIESAEQQLDRVLRTRAIRAKFFDPELFADPAWDILLALYEAALRQRRISVSNCCSAAQVPATTALRHIDALCGQGIVLRTSDPLDARRKFLSLSREATVAMQRILLN